MKKLNIILAAVAIILGLISVYVNSPQLKSSPKKAVVTQPKSTAPVAKVEQSTVSNKISVKTPKPIDKLDLSNVVKGTKKDLTRYKASEFEDEEVYGSKTQIISLEKDYDNFYKKVKDSIVKIKNKNTTFYGVVTKDRQGIHVISDLDTANDSAIVTIKTLTGEELNVDSARKSGQLVAFKIKEPFPSTLKPMPTITVPKGKVISLGAFSFDYGNEPEMTLGKGRIGNNGKCEISSNLRRCRPGTALFNSKGQLYGISTWTPTGNAGSYIGMNINWSAAQYPFKVAVAKKRRNKYNTSRYQ